MRQGPPDSRELGYYFSLAQVGLEMVLPLVVGVVLDHYLGWKPWATLAGVGFGFVGGLTHLIMLANRHDSAHRSKPPGEAP
jgi:ATP synthase protein I